LTRQRLPGRRGSILVLALACSGAYLAVPGSSAVFSSTTANTTDAWTLDALAAPSPLTCAWTGTNSLSLTWTKTTTWAGGYSYERSDALGSGYAVLGTTSGSTSVTANDANPSPPTLRYYRVQSTSGANWVSPYTAASASNTCDKTITTLDNFGGSTNPTGVTVDSSGNVYVSDITTAEVYKVTPGGAMSVYAGTGTAGFSGDGGAATSAQLNSPRSMAFDASGNLYIADSGNNRIRKITPGGTISTYAGTGTASFSGDGGAATSATLNSPVGMSIDTSGNLYVADTSNHRIRKITSGGTISTIAGTGTSGFSGDGGAATSANLASPYDAVADGSGTVYISDTGNNRIRKVTAGTITTVVGGGANSACTYTGTGTTTSLNTVKRLAWDTANSRLIITDNANACIRALTGSTITQIAGNGTAAYTGDNGPAAAATLNSPGAVAISSTGNLFITDSSNHALREVLKP